MNSHIKNIKPPLQPSRAPRMGDIAYITYLGTPEAGPPLAQYQGYPSEGGGPLRFIWAILGKGTYVWPGSVNTISYPEPGTEITLVVDPDRTDG